MKILHILFDDYPFISDWGYQENKISYYQSINNEVFIISAKYVPHILNEFITYDLKEYEKYSIEGHKEIKIFRLKCLFGQTVLAKKIKCYKGLYSKIKEIHPDAIFIHDLHALSLFSVSKYIKENKEVICNADVHTNYANSCKNTLSKFLHRYFYRLIIQRNIKCINKLYYLNNNSKLFIQNMYGINEENCNIQLLPLGGVLSEENEILHTSVEYRKSNNIAENDIIFLHSGKFKKEKKTLELLEAFSSIKNDSFHLLLIGKPYKDIEEKFYNLVEADNRIQYLGWKNNDELMEYLKIADIYLQPGTPSVTAHEAMCNKCAVLLSNYGDYYASFVPNECVYYVDGNKDIFKFFKQIDKNELDIQQLKQNGYLLARKIFDYKKQSEMIVK